MHVNRSVRRLQQEGLVAIEGRHLSPERLLAAATFDPDHLHQQGSLRRP